MKERKSSLKQRKLRAVVVGIPGVGKTTVVQMAAGLLHAKVVTFGTVMFEEAKRLHWVSDRDEMRKMSVERQKKLQKLAAGKIARASDPILMVDTHLFIRTTEGTWPGLPFDIVREMKPTDLVLIEAKPEEIMCRRAADKTRIRDDLSIEALSAELALGRSFLVSASSSTGAPMLILANETGKAGEAAGALVKALTPPAGEDAGKPGPTRLNPLLMARRA